MLIPAVPLWIKAVSFPNGQGSEAIRNKGGVVLLSEGRRSKGDRFEVYRLYLRGRRTAVRLELDILSTEPIVTAGRTRGGIVYGTVWAIYQGALSMAGSFAFVNDRGRQFTVAADEVRARGERLLIVGDGQPDAPERFVNYPRVYANRTLYPIGPATKVHLEGTGRITGWYLANAKDQPFEGSIENAPPLFRRYFVWKDGKRFLKGREPDR